MTPSVETKIWLALKNHLMQYDPSITKLMPAQIEAPPRDKYIRVGSVTVAPQSILIDDGKPHRRTGFLVLSVVMPLHQATEVYDNEAGQLARHFIDGTQVYYGGVCVTVTSYPHIGDGYQESGFWETPVRVQWQCFA